MLKGWCTPHQLGKKVKIKMINISWLKCWVCIDDQSKPLWGPLFIKLLQYYI